MKPLYQELSRRFPEIKDVIRQELDSPYLMMESLTHWLDQQEPETYEPELITRIVSFVDWCKKQPSGKDAADDICTILGVGFYERLFRSSRARCLLPRLLSRSDIIDHESYFKTWVGEDNLKQVLALYDKDPDQVLKERRHSNRRHTRKSARTK